MTRRRTLFLAGVAMAVLLLATPGPAWAHVTVSPEQVAAGDYETLTVSVPTEKEIPTTEVKVVVPEGFTVSGVQPVPGWEYSFEEDGGLITAVSWSGGELGPQEFQQFLLSAQAPEEPGEYSWEMFQTYEDGSVAKWTGPPDAEEPASMVEVVSGASEGHGHASEAGSHERGSESVGEHSRSEGGATVLADTGGIISPVYVGFGVMALTGMALLAMASVALLRKG